MGIAGKTARRRPSGALYVYQKAAPIGGGFQLNTIIYSYIEVRQSIVYATAAAGSRG
jgi:hypothetical protein